MSTSTLSISSPTRSIIVYGAFISWCVVTCFVGTWLMSQGVAVRVFDWDSIALVVLGWLGIYMGTRTGFPHLLDERFSLRQRIGVPALIGIAFGFGDVALFKWVIHPEPITELTPFMQPFPYSVLLYTAGALETEAIHRLIPIPLLMWVIGGGLPKNARSEPLFWVLAVLTSLVEPYNQLLTDSPLIMVYSFLNGFVFNLIQAVYFRKYGFLAALSVRLGHYLIWHVGFGILVEFF